MNSPPYILIVDDDLHVLRFMKTALVQKGYEVTTTISGRRAIDIIEDRTPDLLILDLNMPEPDGFDVLRLERSRCPRLRTLVISGYLQGALLEAARIVGAAATLQKPVTAETLVAKVREVLGR